MVQKLIEKGAEVDVKDLRGATPILNAAENDHPNIVKLLIDNHADIDPIDNLDNTPFEYAVLKGNLLMIS